MGIKGNTYKDRCNHQLIEWVNGNPIHNDIDDECCPDFSCCKPEFLQPLEIRETFRCADEETRMGMLMTFLSGAMDSAFQDKNIHIAGQAKAELN